MEDLTSSLNAFKKAAQMNFDLEIKEDAYLNYAKLSYGIGNSYQEPSFILNDFLKKYPKNKEANYIQKLILESLWMDSQGIVFNAAYFRPPVPTSLYL